MAFKPKANLPDFVQEVPGGAVGVGIGQSAKHGGKFGPAARVEKWGGRGWLEIQCLGSAPRKAVKVKSHPKKGEYLELECTKHGRDEIHSWKEGSTEWDITWPTPNDVPTEGYVDFALTLGNGIAGHHQPALTPWETEIVVGPNNIESPRFVRPDNVINSYAFYGKKSSNVIGADGQPIVSYETGKLLHWYRSKLIDANGSERWVQQELLALNVMRIYLDSNWLNEAVFPVTLDPTLGYSSVGASHTGYWYGTDHVSVGRDPNQISSPGGTVTGMSWYMSIGYTVTLYHYLMELNGSSWNRKTGGTQSYSGGWSNVSITDYSMTAGKNYGVSLGWVGGGAANWLAYDTDASSKWGVKWSYYSPTPADPFVPGPDDWYADYRMSQYLTYTANATKAPPRSSFGRRSTRMFNLGRFL